MATTTTTTKQRLALAICDFLNTSLTDGSLSAEDKDSIEIAVNCIADSFKVDPTDSAALSAAVGTQNLLQIYGVYEKLKTSSASASAAGNSNPPLSPSAASAKNPPPAAGASADPSSTTARPPTDEEKAQAEDLKSQGNRAMAAKDYAVAIDMYTRALGLNPTNAVYLSNRAAAHSAARDHASARADAEVAVGLDPTYTKAWSRLGLARFALGDPRGSMEAYRLGIEHEGNGGSDAMKKGFETARRRVEELEADALDAGPRAAAAAASAGPDLSSLASLLGGLGGGAGAGAGAGADRGAAGGPGGFPDLGSIMNNPMFASMAQSLMSNPEMMQNLMSNPRLREMADRFSSGGGMPDLSSLMSDPSIADMARNMMGGGGGGGGGNDSNNNNNNSGSGGR